MTFSYHFSYFEMWKISRSPWAQTLQVSTTMKCVINLTIQCPRAEVMTLGWRGWGRWYVGFRLCPYRSLQATIYLTICSRSTKSFSWIFIMRHNVTYVCQMPMNLQKFHKTKISLFLPNVCRNFGFCAMQKCEEENSEPPVASSQLLPSSRAPAQNRWIIFMYYT